MVSGALISVLHAESLAATVSVAVFPSSYIYYWKSGLGMQASGRIPA